MRYYRSLKLIPLLIMISLVACRSAPAEPTATEPSPDTVLTAAAQTAEVRLTEAASAPTATPPPSPTASATPTPEPEQTATPVSTAPSPTAAVQATAPGLSGPDQALYEADVTVPDGTTFAAGETFNKTWRLKNAGTTTWSTNYALAFFSGEQMGGAASVPLPKSVAPGESVEVTVTLTAPQTPGNHQGWWILRNADGQLFQQSFFVLINVGGSGTGGATATPGPSATPGSTGSGTITAVSLSVDESSFTGACPHRFTLTTQVTLSGQTTFNIQLEAGADTPYNYNLPPPETQTRAAGTYTFTYFLDLQDSVNGWAQIHITGPVDLRSNRVGFTLTCE